MSPPLYIHRYRLTLRPSCVAGSSSPQAAAGSKPPLRLAGNSLSARTVLDGFLIRCGDGFGCVHPWPELGDPDIDELLAMLRDGRSHRLLKRAMDCAAQDGAARRSGRSLFCRGGFQPPGMVDGGGAGSPRYIPRSHATITGDADFPALAAAGFTTVKLKTRGTDPGIVERVRAAAEARLRVRIDCNGTGIAALRELRPWAEWVDFIEDPEPYAAARWREIYGELGLPLALDRLDGADSGGYEVRVLKPALETCEARGAPVVFTTCMDHPLGQMFAAWEASRYAGGQLEAGLLTHHLFEPDGFIEAVRSEGPELLAPGGTGLGFDALLEALPWERLSRPPCLLMNPRAPLADPPPQLPEGCLVFQTSGSTGTPALVCLTHEAMQANAAAVNDWLGATSQDVWLRVLPEFHVGGMSIRFRAELSGSRVVVDEEKWDARRFVRSAEENRITLTSLVPAQVFDLVAADLRPPAALRAIVVGGGALNDELYHRAQALGWPLLPSFGMTEASSQVATARLDSFPPKPGGPPLELLPCWEARVDEAGQLQLRGAPLLSGRMVRMSDGWDFQRAVDDDGWFTTSDRVRLEGRVLTPLGRCDRVVKILGELVDLDAVESALLRAGLPPERGVVVALPDERAGFRPWLFTDFGSAEAVIAAANEMLPPFSMIAGCRRMELPRSPLGKILRKEVEAFLTIP